MKNTFDDVPVFVGNIYCFWNTLHTMANGLVLPDDIMNAVNDLALLCESYFKDGFCVVFDNEE